MIKTIKPGKLSKGDRIGIVSPSSPMAGLVPHRVKKGVAMIKKLGLRPVVGKNALKITEYTAGNPKERAEDINNFFKDENIKAIISFVGGNHSNQILKYLNFNLIKKNPKIFVGYSDITVLHLAIHTKANLTTFYGPAVITQFAENPEILGYTRKYFEKALMGKEVIGNIKPSPSWTEETLDWFEKEDLKRPRKMKKNPGWEWLGKGKTRGKILGGCITSMMHLRGTEYWPDFKNAIFFWEIPEGEDFTRGEKLENIDAYLTDLELSGVFGLIKGMVIGRPFSYSKEQNEKLMNIIAERTSNYRFPILYSVDVGHTDPMITIPLGTTVELDSDSNRFTFLEKGTS